jgi:hypothetical protein
MEYLLFDNKIWFGVCAVGFELVSAIVYLYGIYRGKTKPHLYTFLVWTIVMTIIFFGQVLSGAGAGAWATGASLFLTAITIPLSIFYGTKDITKMDGLFLILAVSAIIPWAFAESIFLSVLLASLIDALAIIPTIRKTWKDPKSEPLLSWLLAEGKIICGILALAVYAPVTWIYPVQALIMNALLILVIMYRRK